MHQYCASAGDLVLHPLHRLVDRIRIGGCHIRNFVGNIINLMSVVKSSIVFTLGADVYHSGNPMIQQKLVIPWKIWCATQP